jgi:hypothetical protein
VTIRTTALTLPKIFLCFKVFIETRCLKSTTIAEVFSIKDTPDVRYETMLSSPANFFSPKNLVLIGDILLKEKIQVLRVYTTRSFTRCEKFDIMRIDVEYYTCNAEVDLVSNFNAINALGFKVDLNYERQLVSNVI